MTITAPSTATRQPRLDPAGRSFIEVQFPVSKLSKESYDERKGAQGQALTGMGKWWGRKPLVLARAIVLGLLLPATDDPDADRDIFLTLMTMDDEGMWGRVRGSISVGDVYEHCSYGERQGNFVLEKGKPKWRSGLGPDERRALQRRAFLRMSFDRRLQHCVTVEAAEPLSSEAWEKVNAHLGTTATSLTELVQQLGQRRFGHVPRVGDAFCGGGSVPFAAARLGCDVYASDLNPVAALLTWSALNIVGGGKDVAERVLNAQRRVFTAMQQQVDAWGIERSEDGWVADAYLYCNEVLDPATGWRVPLAPSWVVARRAKQVIARLVPDHTHRRFDFEIVEGVTASELDQAVEEGTWTDGARCPVDRDGQWLPVSRRQVTSVDQLRGREGLRLWESDDLVPRPEDVFQERIYCIRWVNPKSGEREYRAPTVADLTREQRVLELLGERFEQWQTRGFIPSRRIEPGDETTRLQRERGWTHWHHLFNPRQLLLGGLLAELSEAIGTDQVERVGLLLSTGRVADLNSRLCRWHSARDQSVQTYYNQALNTLQNYASRPLLLLEQVICPAGRGISIDGSSNVEPADARSANWIADIWITDPGYGDVILYDELSEFFLAWYGERLRILFPTWYTDSKRALNVKGEGEPFRISLAECYQRLTQQMLDDGFQVVMFTHQDPEVWADVGLTLWAAGLQVTAAWTVATETPTTGVKGGGNYVQGTVLLVLRKRQDDRRGDLSDLYPDIQAEVKRQIESMLELDDKEEPNFGDADYQLAAYAAALRVLTGYEAIDEIDVQKELRRTRARGETSPLARLIGQAVRIASDYLVPNGLERAVWRKLGPEERLYLKAIQVEAGGEAREGVYQELARGYGAGPHRELYASRAANRVRFKTPSEMGSRDLRRVGEPGFSGSLLRQLLFAVSTAAHDPERDPRGARTYLRQELPGYWQDRLLLADLLHFLANAAEPLPHWRGDVEAARLLRDSLLNDAV